MTTNSLISERDQFLSRYPEKTMSIRGTDWGVIDTGGNGPCLLMLPGTLGRADIFWQQIEALKDRARLISLSYPDSWSLEDWSQDIVALLQQLGVKKTAVVGSSLGGYLAQFFARTNEERCTTLFAANTLSDNAGLTQKPPYSADLENTDISILRRGFGDKVSEWGETHPDQAELVELLLAESNGRIPPEHLRARLICLKEAPPLPSCPLDLKKIIVIEAADDPLIPEPMRQGVREALNPQATFRFIEGGHFPYLAQPEKYTSILEEGLGLPVTGPNWGDGKSRSL
ncbi:MAG: alpha/beta hydrolase [Proteobacteria bacterium]|nr:alpha/beta hydrolase [Pseudomonadota bacterium]